ncbi:uncharacterized [Tachysurus ichikawai]
MCDGPSDCASNRSAAAAKTSRPEEVVKRSQSLRALTMSSYTQASPWNLSHAIFRLNTSVERVWTFRLHSSRFQR